MKTEALQPLAGKRILILGFGREGWSTYRFLRQHVPTATLAVADKRALELLPTEQRQEASNPSLVKFYLGEQYLEHLADFDIIFKTPGIPKSLPAVKAALENGTQLLSQTQLFFELCPGQIIGITGTKGKSTTTSVIHHVLQEGGQQTILVGNIGQPALDSLEQVTEKTVVVFELSSHQLETLTVSPHIAVVQNITSEHLDYYASTEEYQGAKSAIAKFQQTSDYIIYNPEFAVSAKIAALSPGQHLRYSLTDKPDSAAFADQNALQSRQAGSVSQVLAISELPLMGRHNLANALPAVIVGGLFGMTPNLIGQALKTFRPLPHRLEFFLEKNGVKYYDDSLATTPESVIGALENFNEPIVLIAGGYERHQEFSALAAEILKRPVTGLVLFRPTGERLASAVEQLAERTQLNQPVPEIAFVEAMPAAVTAARTMLAKTGGVILLSPASASFGLFEDYQDRGEQFKAAARND